MDADVNGSKPHFMVGMTSCITRRRADSGGHWLMNRGRRMTVKEMLAFLGMDIKYDIQEGVAARQLRLMIGNSCSVDVLERLVTRALSCRGLASWASMVKRWESLELVEASMRGLMS